MQKSYKQQCQDRLFQQRGSPSTLDELGELLIAHINSKGKQPQVLGLHWEISYIKMISNSHSAPVAGVQNFERNAALPKGYPGFAGRIWFRLNKSGLGSSALSESLTYTGTGGYGTYNGPYRALSRNWHSYQVARDQNKQILLKHKISEPEVYSYDYRIYLADWPLLEKTINQQIIVNTLKGNPTEIVHRFDWVDNETQQQDREFVREWTEHYDYA